MVCFIRFCNGRMVFHLCSKCVSPQAIYTTHPYTWHVRRHEDVDDCSKSCLLSLWKRQLIDSIDSRTQCTGCVYGKFQTQYIAIKVRNSSNCSIILLWFRFTKSLCFQVGGTRCVSVMICAVVPIIIIISWYGV